MNANPPGLTLIEVLAALAILAVLLGGVLTARQSAQRQWVTAGHRLEALGLLDDLLAVLTTNPDGWVAGTGPIEASVPGWAWEIHLASTGQADVLQAQVATVQIVDAQRNVLARVQMLVPVEQPGPEPAPQASRPKPQPGLGKEGRAHG